jgi:hypothetical protein
MELHSSITQETDYLYVKITGEYNLAGFQSLIDQIYAAAMEKDRKDVLMNILEVTGRVPVMDRFTLGEDAARVWKHEIRVAIVYQASEIYKLFENVAVNRSAQVIVVPDMQSAMRWLKGRDAVEGK